MSESKMWATLRDNIGTHWEAERIENRLNTGTPDVAYSMRKVHGWIELKFMPDSPRRIDKPLKIEHFTPDQRNWLHKHGTRGGHCFILLRVGREPVSEWLMFDHTLAYRVGVDMTMDELRKADLLRVGAGDLWERIEEVFTRR